MGSDDLVERLRHYARQSNDGYLTGPALEAADEIERLTAQLTEARESERAAMTEVNGLKDALAQVPEFICRRCGRRQDGPADNEARF